MTSGRVVLLDSLKGRDAAALLVDGHLEELAIDPEGDSILPGAIWRLVDAFLISGMIRQKKDAIRRDITLHMLAAA
jgi:hypothetical protein